MRNDDSLALNHSQQADVSRGTRRATVAPFQVRGRFFTAIVLQIDGGPDAEFYKALDAVLAQAPHFFTNAPFVLDLDKATGIGVAFDFLGFMRELRRRRITLIGVQNGTIDQNRAALTAGLITMQGGRDLPSESVESHGAEPKEADTPSRTLLITTPVRSGQQIFSDMGDLVVVNSVSSGAELIARGNIHVYGRMRGRALAGVNGDAKARIFCQCLEAELIAINGLYVTSEGIDPTLREKRIQAYLQDGALCIGPLK